MNKRHEYPAFLGSELGPQNPETSLFHIVPVPYEKTVTYGKGTEKGPSAILKASWQLEIFDGKGVPAERGIFTHGPIDCAGRAEDVISRIEKTISLVLSSGKIPVMLGGEHTVSLGAARAVRKSFTDAGIIQLDAHADLRNVYDGTRLSHACIMRRVHDLGIPFVQMGVRSLSPDEKYFRESNEIRCYDAPGLNKTGLPANWMPEGFPKDVYVTIDIDSLDSSIMPATGTPEPGGLSWYMTLDILMSIAKQRRIVGFDLVELAPVAGLHHCDYTAAKLIYLFMGAILYG
ncbi:MAG: agmatinase [Desulfobacteraceae bacterium]|nr:MAG: agmatinase [Desulfobacteraceae bacterium]